ncbi:Pyruvate-flavodoxin oxidoreductase [Nocardioides sp. T2.26MG-1]|nr:Pyruvate-flavodoxin oxidoreductase [Nocardioides sp. T2.26MG-1]
MYSNTGGQASKATPWGAVARFASGGKQAAKKDLGYLARGYPDVYVATVALGANQMQTLRALREAQAWSGVSLVIAYASCVEHGIDMADGLAHQQAAVTSGYWPLYRHQPTLDRQGRLTLDSKPPSIEGSALLATQGRFQSLRPHDPDSAADVAAQLDEDNRARWANLVENSGRTER